MMSLSTIRELGGRIQEYCAYADVAKFNVVFHGGEPLLLGAGRLDTLLTGLRASAAPARLQYSIQTNGTLLTPDICDLLSEHNVLVGISLDGGPGANAKRVTLKGEPTFDAVAENIALLKSRAAHLFGGILCVVNLDTDPIETIASLCSHGPPEIDLLYPFVTHDHVGTNRAEFATKFGTWMKAAMEFWLAHPKFSEVRIRVFEDALQATISKRPQTDWFGPRNIGYLVVETGGNYDLLDQLKVIGSGSARFRNIQANVRGHSISEAIALAADLLKAAGGSVLPADCVGCKWSDVCAGSHLPARHSLSRGFGNKSVYCEGLMSLLNCVHEKMVHYKQHAKSP
jgi:uncharacterized protein